MAAAMGLHGTTRAYVAKTREELFPGQSPAWAMRYSRTFVDGWYVDTNLNRERMRRILPAAVRAAGLAWGPGREGVLAGDACCGLKTDITAQ